MKLLQEVTAQVPAGVTPPSNAGSPMQWAIVTALEQEPSDQNKKFEHYTSFVSSSGDILFQSPISLFEFKAEQHRITGQVNGMPIGRVGKHHVKCYLREKGNAVWTEYGSYPIRIKWASSLIATPN
ncbi:MAG: hypothetical protein ACLQBA_10980 [Candidatus Binataceae bacterium]